MKRTACLKKTVSDSRVAMAYVMQPQNSNPSGIVHGGVVMKYIDDAAGVVALRHSGHNAVTASIDRLDFHNPVFIGNLLKVKASLNFVGKTSMEIGVRVEAEDLRSGLLRHTASAYLTFVALNDNFKPVQIPELNLISKDDKRRNKEAVSRREIRLAEKSKEKRCQDDEGF